LQIYHHYPIQLQNVDLSMLQLKEFFDLLMAEY